MKQPKPNIQCPPNDLGYEDYGQYKVLWRTWGVVDWRPAITRQDAEEGEAWDL